MTTEGTSEIRFNWARAEAAGVQGPPAATPQREGVADEERRAMKPSDRATLLEALYMQRRQVTRASRMGELSAMDSQHLADINRYIDFLEAEEESALSETRDVWQKLNELSDSLLILRADALRNRAR